MASRIAQTSTRVVVWFYILDYILEHVVVMDVGWNYTPTQCLQCRCPNLLARRHR